MRLGPTLGQPPFNVPEALADPVLAIFDVNGQQIASNDNWQDSQAAEIQATGKAPPNSSESAIVIARPVAILPQFCAAKTTPPATL